MEPLKIENYQIENQDFFNEYLELLINRITHSNMSAEKDLGNPDNSENAIRLRDNIRAFKILLNSMQVPLDENLIIKVANEINRSSPYISNGYRSLGDFIADTSIPITSPADIPFQMLSLIQKYQGEWQTLSPYEREAIFHIEFIRIHPFEDGNGRTARLLLNYNLLKQQIAPIVITEELLEYYQDYIKNNDIKGMTNLFQIQSLKEHQVLNTLYEEYHQTKETQTGKKVQK